MAHLLVSAHQSAPAHSAFAAQHRPTWGLSPSSGSPSRRCPSGHAAVSRATDGRPPVIGWSQTTEPPGRLHSPALARHPVDSPSPFTPWNGWELNPHHCRPPASLVPPCLVLPDPIKGPPTSATTSTTHSYCPHFVFAPPSATPPSSSRRHHPSPPSAQLSHPATQCHSGWGPLRPPLPPREVAARIRAL
jgi:hypothetical protein